MLKPERKRGEFADFATRANSTRSHARSLNPSRACSLIWPDASLFQRQRCARTPPKYRAATCLLSLTVVHGSVCRLRTPPTKSSSRCTGRSHNHGFTLATLSPLCPTPDVTSRRHPTTQYRTSKMPNAVLSRRTAVMITRTLRPRTRHRSLKYGRATYPPQSGTFQCLCTNT